MRLQHVVGNWKMNGSLAANQALLDALIPALKPLGHARFAVCAPYPYLAQVRQVLANSPVSWGAQDVCQFDNGAYTGEVSAAMLLDFGCRYAIVGHSERRALFGDTNEVVAAKFDAARKAGLTPILCVGETLAERESGVTEQVVAAQLDAVIARCGAGSLADAVLAYEPVWAIGTGKTATSAQAQEVHAFIRGVLSALHGEAVAKRVRIQYGGSVKANNARELLGQPDIDGALVGGAALEVRSFADIIKNSI